MFQFKKQKKHPIGERVTTTKPLYQNSTTLPPGSKVQIIGNSDCGYDVIDTNGVYYAKCGWDI